MISSEAKHEIKDLGSLSKKGYSRRKGCRFCTDKDVHVDYKNALMLAGFLTEKGKITPRRVSGNCSLHQRAIAKAVKRARFLALLSHVDGFHPGPAEGSVTP